MADGYYPYRDSEVLLDGWGGTSVPSAQIHPLQKEAELY